MAKCPRISPPSCCFPDSHMPHLLSTCEDVPHSANVNSFLPFPLCDFSLLPTEGILLNLGPGNLPHLMVLSVTHILLLPSVSPWCWWQQFCPCSEVTSILSHSRQTPWSSVSGRAESLAMLEPTPPLPTAPRKILCFPLSRDADFWVQHLLQLRFPWLPKQPVWLVLCWLAVSPRAVFTCFTNHWPGSLQHALRRPPLPYVLPTWASAFPEVLGPHACVYTRAWPSDRRFTLFNWISNSFVF